MTEFLEYSININSWLSNEEPSNLLSSLGIIPPLEPELEMFCL